MTQLFDLIYYSGDPVKSACGCVIVIISIELIGGIFSLIGRSH